MCLGSCQLLCVHRSKPFEEPSDGPKNAHRMSISTADEHHVVRAGSHTRRGTCASTMMVKAHVPLLEGWPVWATRPPARCLFRATQRIPRKSTRSLASPIEKNIQTACPAAPRLIYLSSLPAQMHVVCSVTATRRALCATHCMV